MDKTKKKEAMVHCIGIFWIRKNKDTLPRRSGLKKFLLLVEKSKVFLDALLIFIKYYSDLPGF